MPLRAILEQKNHYDIKYYYQYKRLNVQYHHVFAISVFNSVYIPYV